MLPKESYSAIFDECILRKPKRLKQPDLYSETANYPIPPEIVDRENSGERFKPVGIIPGGKKYEAYFPADDPIIRPDVIIARDPDHPLQRIVGPKHFVDQIMLSFFYLKHFFGKNNPFHHMDLIASNSYSTTNPYDVKRDGYLWTQKLINELNIEKMRDRYSMYGPWNQEKPHVGIRKDIPWPVFFMQYIEDSNSSQENEIAIKQASNIVHDFTHYLLSLHGYQASGPVAERICLTNQAVFLEAIYCNNSGLFNNSDTVFNGWTKGTDGSIADYFGRIIKYIHDYRSGGNIALDESQKAFGYKILKVSEDSKYPTFKDFR